VSKVVGEIAIEVGADIGPLVREMSRADTVLGRFKQGTDRLGKGLDRFADRTAALGRKLSIVSGVMAGVAAAAFALAKNTSAAIDEIGDSAKAAGMSTTAFQEYRFALKEAAAMTDEEFAASVTRLNKTLGEARTGSASAINAFEAIGISQAQLADGSFTTDQAMAAFIAKMEATKDPAIAAALATDLFGKAGASLGAGLSGVPGQVKALVDRAKELGIALGPDAFRAADEFEGKMGELGAQFELVKMKIAEVLLPLIVDKLIPALQEVVIPAILAVVETVGGWITAFGQLDPAIQEVVGWIVGAFAVGGPVLLAIAAVSSAISLLIGATGPIGLMILAATALYTAWQVWGDDIKAAVGGAIDWITTKFNDFMALLDRIIQKIKDVVQSVRDALPELTISGAGESTYADPKMAGGGKARPTPAGGGAGGVSGGSSMGAAIVNGAFLGAVGAMNEKREAFAALFAQIPQIARDTLGIKSPSTVFAEIGNFLGQGMAEGITDSTALVGAAAKGMAGAAVSSVGEGVSGVLSAMGTLFEGSKKISAGIALANSWLAFTEVLKDPSFIGRPWARAAAAFAALKPGLQAVKNIQSARPGGGGGGGAASAAAPAGGGGGVANITLVGDRFSGDGVVSIFDQINDGIRRGMKINLVRA
jgi:hypothetical protein